MRGIIKKIIRKDNLGYKGFKINYESVLVKNEVISWLESLNVSDFSDILINLGFKKTEIIYLYENYGSLYRINYSVNEDKYNSENSIQFNFVE